MNCATCGRELIDGDAPCGNCESIGSSDFDASDAVDDSGAESQTAPAKKRSVFGTRRIRVLGLGLVGITVASLLYVFVPSKVIFVELYVQDVNGGAFNDTCKIEEEAKALIPTTLEVRPASSKTPGSIHSLEYFPSPQGGCVGRTSISVTPFSTSDVRDRFVLGKIGAQEIATGEAVLAMKVALKRDLTVKFTLTDVADYCRVEGSGWSCSWNNDWTFGLQLNANASTCRGKNGYSDIKSGASVTVTGIQNRKTSTSTLTGEGYDLPNVRTKRIVCRFSADLNGIPNDPEGYSVEIAKRGDVNFTLKSLRGSNWTAEVTLGN